MPSYTFTLSTNIYYILLLIFLIKIIFESYRLERLELLIITFLRLFSSIIKVNNRRQDKAI